MTEIPKRDSRKPDPDEPWRYVCPDCKGQVTGGNSKRTFRCNRCGGEYAKVQLFDQKTQRIVQENTSGPVPKDGSP